MGSFDTALQEEEEVFRSSCGGSRPNACGRMTLPKCALTSNVYDGKTHAHPGRSAFLEEYVHRLQCGSRNVRQSIGFWIIDVGSKEKISVWTKDIHTNGSSHKELAWETSRTTLVNEDVNC